MSRALHIIFLPSWYPVPGQELNGIFNRELAELISGRHRVSLLHIHFDPNLKEENISRFLHPGNFTETIVYLPGKGNFLRRQWRYFRSFFREMNMIHASEKADLVHVQVAWKMGLMAWLWKLRYGIRYIVTEHYTGYLPQDGALRGWKKWSSYFLLKNAEAVTAVSPALQNVLLDHGVKNVRVIPNRIDGVFFQSAISVRKDNNRLTFIHVSNFDDRQKQSSVIISEFQKFHKLHPETSMIVLGPRKEITDMYGENYDWSNSGIRIFEPVNSRSEYLKILQMGDAMLSFSFYETFSLVLAEALCIGMPVIYTRSGGPETFVESEMGIEVDAQNPKTLFDAMEKMLSGDNFNRPEIARRMREKMNSGSILNQYEGVYNSIVI